MPICLRYKRKQDVRLLVTMLREREGIDDSGEGTAEVVLRGREDENLCPGRGWSCIEAQIIHLQTQGKRQSMWVQMLFRWGAVVAGDCGRFLMGPFFCMK